MSKMGNMYNNNDNNNNNNDSSRTNTNQLFQGEIISCYRKYFNNTNKSSSFMHGMLKYMGQNHSIETIEFCTKQSNLNIGDIVTFNFSTDKTALNPYANNVIKYDFNQERKQQEVTGQRNTNKNKNKNKNNKHSVRLICISDTHNSHDKLTKELCDIYRSESDILIHCGDMTDSGSERELKEVNKWFGKLPYKHIIITAGNMDGIGLDRNNRNNYYYYDDNNNNNDDNDSEYGNKYSLSSKNSFAAKIFTNAVYLEHESYYLKEYNLRFFASPYSMKFVGGFQVNNDREADSLWKQIPNNTDILICHGPPLNILDSTSRGKHAGDKVLLNHVIKRIKPKVMLFGHMHSSFGYTKYQNIHFYNCAQANSLNHHYGGYSSNSYYNSNKKDHNMKNEKPQIINLSNLS